MNGNLNVQPQNNPQGGSNPFEIFNYKNLGSVRTTLDQNGVTWFSLPDVCNVVGITNSRNLISRIDAPYVHSMDIGVQTGVFPDGNPIIQNVSMNFVNEAGLYQAIGNSRKPEAKKFMAWVFEEVLPSIRKKGYYTMQPMTEMEMINKMSGTIIEQQKTIDMHGERLDQHDMMLEMYSHQIEILSHEGYFTIATHARFRNIPISLETAQTLGTIATKICEERGIGVASIPHPTYTFIHAYPYEILNEVFSNYFSN